MAENTNSQTSQQPKKPGAEHQRLNLFVGKWIAEGETRDGRTVPIHAVDTYAWLPGGYFLVHTSDARVGEDEYTSTEIIGYDDTQKAYSMHFFDSWGQTETYQATVHDTTWTLVGETARATIIVCADGSTMHAEWEMSSNGSEWHPWMVTTLTKAT